MIPRFLVKFGSNHRHSSPQPLFTSGHVCTAVAAALPDTSSSYSSSLLAAAGGIWEQAEPTPELLARLSPGGQQCPGPAQRTTRALCPSSAQCPVHRHMDRTRKTTQPGLWGHCCLNATMTTNFNLRNRNKQLLYLTDNIC